MRGTGTWRFSAVVIGADSFELSDLIWRMTALSQEGVSEEGDAVVEGGCCSAESEHEAVHSVAALVVLSKAPQGEAVVVKRCLDDAALVEVTRQGEGDVQASRDASDVWKVDG